MTSLTTDCDKLYIDGRWVPPLGRGFISIINPATEQQLGRLCLGCASDVDAAVTAARAASVAWSKSTREARLQVLQRIIAEYSRRIDDMAEAIHLEMGAPSWLAQRAQAPTGLRHFEIAEQVLRTYGFVEDSGNDRIVKEPIGVCGLITPWNWPANQIACKLAPALATGCTVVLKPSELAPLSAQVWAEILDAVQLPPGVFNLVTGDGPTVGAALSRHPGIDMISFTGSTRAGIEVARNAAQTVKRVHQELGGKSANILLDDAMLDKSIADGIRAVFINSGQSCNAPTRLFVPQSRLDDAVRVAKRTAEAQGVGDKALKFAMGPLASAAQWQKVQALIGSGLTERATLITGGLGRPEGCEKGFYARPTVFGPVTPSMRIAREEIFGPVVVILTYRSVDEAIELANDSEYGLAAYVSGLDMDLAQSIALQLKAGQVVLNNAQSNFSVPFGGYKQSGNGREWGKYGFDEMLETKAIIGFNLRAVSS